ncbi:hypothetical protein CBS101457_002490 [Exobasidium rhododendri]|nr:hypothetical protein CBS101457_002490 [Exobasidium rhododendri]
MAGSSFYEQLLNATSKGSANYALYSVPALWALCILPHFYAVGLSKGKFTNSSPRGYVAEIQKKEKKSETDKMFIRAEACQQNGFENLPFFAAAILAATFAKLPNHEVNKLAGAYLASRVAYTILYVFNSSEAISNLRSVAFLVGVGINWTLFIKAGLALN